MTSRLDTGLPPRIVGGPRAAVVCHEEVVFVDRVFMLAAACGSSGSPAPTPQIPNVVGNYSGSTIITFPELGPSRTKLHYTGVGAVEIGFVWALEKAVK